jgi:hypothetical protein
MILNFPARIALVERENFEDFRGFQPKKGA